MENCNHNCSSCPSKGNCAAEIAKEPCNKYASVKKVIAVVSSKGGVGKSMVTAMLASAMQQQGKRTAVLDADITGPSIPKTFGVSGRACGNEFGILPMLSKGGVQMMSVNLLLNNPTDPVIWRGPVIAGTVKQFWSDVIWEDVEYMFIDMPPGTGDVTLTVFQSLPVDGLIIVTTPQELVEMIVEKVVKMAGMLHIPVLGLVENCAYFVCDECEKKHYIYGESRAKELAARYDIPLLAQLPLDPAIARACDEGRVEELQLQQLDELLNSL